jgi:hypothetical protein
MTNTKGVTLRAYLLALRPYLAPPRAWWMVVTFCLEVRSDNGWVHAFAA